MSTRSPDAASPLDSSAASTPPRVGQQIQKLRTERKLTLEDLSRAAGVSKSMLSEIERNRANPTIAVVWRLTNALGVSLDYLFAPQKQQDTIHVLGAHESPTLASADQGYQLRVWGPVDLAGTFEWYELVLQPNGALISEAHEPGTREHLTVFQGAVMLEVDGRSHRVRKGETARYPADVAHALRNAEASPATALLVVVHS